jgi:hypothetical protein
MMRRPNNARLRRLLEHARESIRTGRSRYICYALSFAAVHHNDHEGAEYLRRYIMRELAYPHSLHLEDWLKKTDYCTWLFTTDYDFIQHRLRWIDWMLEEL